MARFYGIPAWAPSPPNLLGGFRNTGRRNFRLRDEGVFFLQGTDPSGVWPAYIGLGFNAKAQSNQSKDYLITLAPVKKNFRNHLKLHRISFYKMGSIRRSKTKRRTR